MDVVTLSRIQFALTVGFHFIFVPLTIGLVPLVAILETLYVRTQDPKYKRLARFWGKLFAINFVLGVVTGVTMEFQFGTNWSRYAEFMGDIFGSPLAFEALTAFFLESTFLGIWLFGWKKLSPKMQAFAAWMVALGTHLSAVWIIVANGFMQNPVGYVLRNNRAEMVDFLAVLTNPYAWHMYVHTILASYCVGAFFVLGVSAYHLLRRQHLDLMRTSFKAGLALALVGTIGVAVSGHFNGQLVAAKQPTKFAAMEALWETQSGAPFYLLVVPDESAERNAVQALPVPKLTSWLATGDVNAEVKGLKEFAPEDRPPVGLVFWSFRLMILLGLYMLAMAVIGWVLLRKGRLEQSTRYLRWLPYSIPVPYIAINLGWMVAEVGRQPWTVYGLMRTADSVSPVPAGTVLLSLAVITVVYTLLIGTDIYLLARYARKGPEALPELGQPAAAQPGEVAAGA
ncbi:MAG: cytochrome ubiquinol oxidase subunit I [Bacillota bacterium]